MKLPLMLLLQVIGGGAELVRGCGCQMMLMKERFEVVGGSSVADERVEEEIALRRQSRGAGLGAGGGGRGGQVNEGRVGEKRDAGVEFGDQVGRKMRVKRAEVCRHLRVHITEGKVKTTEPINF